MAYWKINYRPSIDLQNPVLAKLIGASEANTRIINRLPLPPKMQLRLDELFIKRETLGTTAIEGNTLAEGELELDNTLETIITSNSQDDEAKELENSRKVIAFLYKEALDKYGAQVSQELILQLHAIITEGCHKNDNVPGKFRTHEITVGKNYSGERFENIPRQIEAFLQFINSEEAFGYGAVIRAILAHFYLVSIHPFSDGNGRTARALEAYILAQAQVNVRGFYSLANFYYKNRELYFQKLDEARFKYKGDLNDFVLFAYQGFVGQQEETLRCITAFIMDLALESYIDDLLQLGKINTRGYALVEYIWRRADGGIPLSTLYAKRDAVVNSIYQKVTERTLRRDVKKLLGARIVVVEDNVLKINRDVINDFVRNKMVLKLQS